MAKNKIRVTAAMAAEAEPYFSAVVAAKLNAIGAKAGAKRFKADGPLRQRQSRRAYQRYLDDGGKVGDWQSFMEWLLEHADEIIAFIAKLIALFAV